MSRIDGFNTLLLQIRAQLTQRTARSTASRSNTPSSSASRQNNSIATESLRLQVKGAIAGLDLQNPASSSIAKQRFIETILIAELGPAVANDTRFLEVSQGVAEAIAEDARLSMNLEKLLKEMATEA